MIRSSFFLPVLRRSMALAATALLAACVHQPPMQVSEQARLTPASRSTRDLQRLPEPKGRIVVGVYGFRDQTGQYRPAPDSSFSTAVTQGAASLLVKALRDSGWFVPVERENLQNLLTERKIIRALETPQDKSVTPIPQLTPATVIIEGGIVAYESNVRTGGAGARYLGIGLSGQYRVDQVTVNLRTVDIRTGQILNSVSTTKTIYSHQLSSGVFQFVSFKKLLELESGFTRNEPAQLCVKEAIEAAVIHLIVDGLRAKAWVLRDERQMAAAVIQDYLRALNDYGAEIDAEGARTGPAAVPAEGAAGGES